MIISAMGIRTMSQRIERLEIVHTDYPTISVVRINGDHDLWVELRYESSKNGVLLTSSEFIDYIPVIEYVYENNHDVVPYVEFESCGRKFECYVGGMFKMQVEANHEGLKVFSGPYDWLETIFECYSRVLYYLNENQ